MARRSLTREQAIAIYLAPGPQKIIAFNHGVSQSVVANIKRGWRYGSVAKEWRETAILNAMLATMAVTGAA